MAPDLNSLPASWSVAGLTTFARAMSDSPSAGDAPPQHQTLPTSPSPRSASTSLQAAATLNAGLQQESTTRSPTMAAQRARQLSYPGRRRSNVLANLQLNDPALPGPGEMVGEPHLAYRTASPQSLTGSPTIPSSDPRHSRAPSLGEIHQELEQEQEAQVNRLLQMIRQQQHHLQQLQAASGTAATPTAIDELTPTSEHSISFSNPSQSTALRPRSSFDAARADLQRRSRTPSRTASPRLGSTAASGDGGESWSLSGRDESAFYQAETQMLNRENQMLRQRIRELERQVAETNQIPPITHEPATPSLLLRSESVTEGPSTSTSVSPATEQPKEE